MPRSVALSGGIHDHHAFRRCIIFNIIYIQKIRNDIKTGAHIYAISGSKQPDMMMTVRYNGGGLFGEDWINSLQVLLPRSIRLNGLSFFH